MKLLLTFAEGVVDLKIIISKDCSICLKILSKKKLLKIRNVIQIYKYEQIFSFIFMKKGEALIFAFNFTFCAL